MTAQRIFEVKLEVVKVTIGGRQKEIQKSIMSPRTASASDRVGRS